MIYLDYAAATPPTEKALYVYTKVSQEYFGNSHSLHDTGTQASSLLESARQQLAALICGNQAGIYFTSGGSEGNYLALSSLAKAYRHKGNHLITTSVEHSSLLNTFSKLEEEGFQVTYLPVDETGRIRIKDLEEALTNQTILVSINHVNSEIGTIQPLEQIGNLLYKKNILFHSDCVQSFGKHEIDVNKCHLSSITLSSHKVYGPKGVGAVYISPEVNWHPVIPNSSHEKGFRSGTVNVPGICSFVTAAQECIERLKEEKTRIKQLRYLFLSAIQSPHIVIEGNVENQSPYIIGLRIKGIEGQYIMLECNRNGLAVSTGTACQLGHSKASKTMVALGRSEEQARELIRLSFGFHTTEEEVKNAAEIFNKIVKSLTSSYRESKV
ncbi:IscS subfamily cysteine desulfurase [Bacillus taeanensis]|uniref:Cysteine desulfurase n=1 Tax=Bacillus taeanensis TaxID=273032 RepID=A0A366XYY0_9BACI|nr:IscS subfamily cysteine desulfurase [Bacillus taeanensis]RBW71610.1 cysteine desulfurase [Bacillus taeanensis]